MFEDDGGGCERGDGPLRHHLAILEVGLDAVGAGEVVVAAHLVDVVAHELGHAVVDGGVEDLVELGDVDGAVASGGGGVRRGGGGGGGGAAVEDARGGARGVRGAERGHAGELRGRAVSQRGERRLERRRGGRHGLVGSDDRRETS